MHLLVCKRVFGAMRLEKDYRQQKVLKSLVKYMPSKRITTQLCSHGKMHWLSKNSLDRCEIHILIVKAYEAMKHLSPWLCITRISLSYTNRLVQVKISQVREATG